MEEQVISKVGKDIIKLYKEQSYTSFDEGYFLKVPKLKGYLFRFQNLKSPKVILLVNTNSSFSYDKKYIKLKDYHFIVFNCSSIKYFIGAISSNLLNILEVLKSITTQNENEEQQKDSGLPYGYYEDKNGVVQVDTKQANEVRQIFKLYTTVRSIKRLAEQMGTNFSHIRDILHDDRYTEMERPIVPQIDLKKVKQILFINRKNKSVK